MFTIIQVFTPVNPDESMNFNESRLSLGMGRLSMGSVANYQAIDGMRLVQRWELIIGKWFDFKIDLF